MTRIVSASLGTAVWRAGLADPYLHWKRSKSAWEMAVSWEAQRNTASGLPPEVSRALASHPDFADPQLLLGVVEHRVVLDTPKTPSQNDLWAVLLTASGQVSVAVEAKAGEDFDRPLREWLRSDGEGKDRRLRFLCDQLGLNEPPSEALRYQLFHRTASALLEAKRWRISRALMLVQSFSESKTSWQDFQAFAALLDLDVARNAVAGPRGTSGLSLYLCWVDSPKATDDLAAAAV